MKHSFFFHCTKISLLAPPDGLRGAIASKWGPSTGAQHRGPQTAPCCPAPPRVPLGCRVVSQTFTSAEPPQRDASPERRLLPTAKPSGGHGEGHLVGLRARPGGTNLFSLLGRVGWWQEDRVPFAPLWHGRRTAWRVSDRNHNHLMQEYKLPAGCLH